MTARRLVTWNLVTLDGYFEGREKWALDFHDRVWGDELERFSLDQLQEVGTLVFGRVTYEGMAAYWSKAEGEIARFMNGMPKVVFSRTLESADWSNTTLVSEDAVAAVARMKEEPGKDLFIFGSADLTASLARAGLIDEHRLGLVPVLLGGGTPLFKPSEERTRLRLIECRPTGSGCVILRYETVRGPGLTSS